MSESLGKSDDKSLSFPERVCVSWTRFSLYYLCNFRTLLLSPMKLRLPQFNLPRVPQLVCNGVRCHLTSRVPNFATC